MVMNFDGKTREITSHFLCCCFVQWCRIRSSMMHNFIRFNWWKLCWSHNNHCGYGMACCAIYYESLPIWRKSIISIEFHYRKINAFYAVCIGTIQAILAHLPYFINFLLGLQMENFSFPNLDPYLNYFFGFYDQCCVCVIAIELQQQWQWAVSSSCGSHTTTISFVFVYIYSSSDNIGWYTTRLSSIFPQTPTQLQQKLEHFFVLIRFLSLFH